MVVRTMIFYGALVVSLRLMGKRQVGQMEPSEFVVTMLLANLASIPIEDLSLPVWHGLIPIGLVLLAERGVSLMCLKSIRLRRLLCGKPVILIHNGQLLYDALRRTRVNLDELTGHLRELGILELEQVQYAILETNGAVTAFPYPEQGSDGASSGSERIKKQELPYTVISDGHLLRENLRLAGKDEQWLTRALSREGVERTQVALMTVTESGKTCLIRR